LAKRGRISRLKSVGPVPLVCAWLARGSKPTKTAATQEPGLVKHMRWFIPDSSGEFKHGIGESQSENDGILRGGSLYECEFGFPDMQSRATVVTEL